MSLTSVQRGLYIGNKDDVTNFYSLKPANSKVRILTVDSEPAPTAEGEKDGVVTKHVYCLDEPEADLPSFFDECADFIFRGLETGETILVHCWAGESRSTTVVLAYIMKANQMSLSDALDYLKKVYPKGSPNSGFLKQLHLYEAMGNILDKTNPVYKQYRLQLLASQIQSQQYVSKDALSSLIDNIKNKKMAGQRMFKCRKCRFTLFCADDLIEHEVGHGNSSFKWRKRDSQVNAADSSSPGSQCTSFFTEPSTWMLPLLVGNVEGKLSCPKCQGRLGSFNWAGMQCSCGQWVTPSFQFHKNRVDEAWSNHTMAARSNPS